MTNLLILLHYWLKSIAFSNSFALFHHMFFFVFYSVKDVEGRKEIICTLTKERKKHMFDNCSHCPLVPCRVTGFEDWFIFISNFTVIALPVSLTFSSSRMLLPCASHLEFGASSPMQFPLPLLHPKGRHMLGIKLCPFYLKFKYN